MAAAADPRGVPRAAAGGHRGPVHRRVHRHQDRGRLPLQGLRRRAVQVRGEVRLALRLAELLPADQGRRGGADRGPLARLGPHRGALRQLRLASGARVRGRGLPGADRSALVHQLGLADAGAGRRRRRIGRELMPGNETAPRSTAAGDAAGLAASGLAGSGLAASGLRLIRAGDLSGATAQTSGMARAAAISADLVGAQSLWMGRTALPPGASSGDHHHGESETGIYVVSGSPAFVFRDPASGELVRLAPAPGDYIWVPPHVPHREENRSPDTEAVVVIARSTQEAIVVNVSGL